MIRGHLVGRVEVRVVELAEVCELRDGLFLEADLRVGLAETLDAGVAQHGLDAGDDVVVDAGAVHHGPGETGLPRLALVGDFVPELGGLEVGVEVLLLLDAFLHSGELGLLLGPAQGGKDGRAFAPVEQPLRLADLVLAQRAPHGQVLDVVVDQREVRVRGASVVLGQLRVADDVVLADSHQPMFQY